MSLPQETLLAQANNSSDSMQTDFSEPSRSIKRSRQSISIDSPPLTTDNRFAPLATMEEEPAHKPPPIYVKNVSLQNYKHFISLLKSVSRDGFECQATQGNGVTVFPRTAEVYRAFIALMKESNMTYHTYQLPQDRAYRVVIRHLHPGTDPEEIREALTAASFEVRSIVNVLQSGTRIPLNFFFVDLEPRQGN
jgi:hypothetical protein